jgi:hypothetical protein
MTNEEARYYVGMALRATGCALVYEGRERAGRRAVPDLVVMDPDTGASSRVRVMVGKAPRRSLRMSFDARRLGIHADVLALVHPKTASVDLRPLTPQDVGSIGALPLPGRTGVLPSGSSPQVA